MYLRHSQKGRGDWAKNADTSRKATVSKMYVYANILVQPQTSPELFGILISIN